MCEYLTKPKRIRNDTRMILHVEGVHGQRYKDWCALSGVTVRHGLGVLMHDLATEQAVTKSQGLDLDHLGDKLAASEEARRTALQQAETCRRQIAECEGLRRAALERANTLERDLARLHQMTAWDHVRAAVGKSGLSGRFVATVIGLSLLASALRTVELVWGMI